MGGFKIGDGGRFHHGNMDFGKAGLILGQKLGQDRANGLRLPDDDLPVPSSFSIG